MSYVHAVWLVPLAVNISLTYITVIFIVFAAAVGAFVRKRSRDKCLRDFSENMVTLQETAGKINWRI